jgi:ataxin-10
MEAVERFAAALKADDTAAACEALDEVAAAARDASTRASLARAGAPVKLAAALAAVAAKEEEDARVYLRPLMSALRNLCAGEPVATGGVCNGGGSGNAPTALAILIPRLAAAAGHASDPQDPAVTSLVVAVQLAANCCVGGGAPSEATWRALFPRAMSAVANLRGPAAHRAHPPLCMFMHARVMFGGGGAGGGGGGGGAGGGGGVSADEAVSGTVSGGAASAAAAAAAAAAEKEASLCGFAAGATVWAPLLAAAADASQPAGAGGGEWLPRLISAACLFSGEALPPLCRSLAPRAAEVGLAHFSPRYFVCSQNTFNSIDDSR